MNLKDLQKQAIEILEPLSQWSERCHEASIALVKAGIGTRVARGYCKGVGAQHSWVVVGNDCYDPKADIIDPTLWSYRSDVEGLWIGSAKQKWHTPHGFGSIWDWGRPTSQGGKVLQLNAQVRLSSEAELFLQMLGPLDAAGWFALLSLAPVGGWPAKEILEAAYNTPALKAIIPIDKVGMVTDLNPGGLYLK